MLLLFKWVSLIKSNSWCILHLTVFFHNNHTVVASLQRMLELDLYLKQKNLSLSHGSMLTVVLNQQCFVLTTGQGDLLTMAADINPHLLVMNTCSTCSSYLESLSMHFWFSGSGFGEPHYQTFDGYWRIGFYGHGYYTVLKIEQNHNFTLQSDLDGLVIRSLAFGVQGVESYQVLAIIIAIHTCTNYAVTVLACI